MKEAKGRDPRPKEVEPASPSLCFPDNTESSESLAGIQALYLVHLYSSHSTDLTFSVWSPPTVVCPALLSSGTEAGTCTSDVTTLHFSWPHTQSDSYISHCQQIQGGRRKAEPRRVGSEVKNG